MSEEMIPMMEELATALYSAKQREKAEKQARVEIEEKIASLVSTPDAGSRTVEAGHGLKVTVKRSVSYKVDEDGISGVKGCDSILKTTTKVSVNVKAYESLRETDAVGFNELAKFITVKPLKTSVTLKIA